MGKKLNKESINTILKEKVAPQLNLHGGGIVLKSLENGAAVIKFTGACAGCMAADQTLENVVKKILFEEFPDLKSVETDDSIDQDLLDFAKKLMSRSGK